MWFIPYFSSMWVCQILYAVVCDVGQYWMLATAPSASATTEIKPCSSGMISKFVHYTENLNIILDDIFRRKTMHMSNNMIKSIVHEWVSNVHVDEVHFEHVTIESNTFNACTLQIQRNGGRLSFSLCGYRNGVGKDADTDSICKQCVNVHIINTCMNFHVYISHIVQVNIL